MLNLLRFLSSLVLFISLSLGLAALASAGYLVRGLDKAIEDKAHLVVIEMGTPGWLDSSMHDFIKAILAFRLL